MGSLNLNLDICKQISFLYAFKFEQMWYRSVLSEVTCWTYLYNYTIYNMKKSKCLVYTLSKCMETSI